jgi:hypothetical protein
LQKFAADGVFSKAEIEDALAEPLTATGARYLIFYPTFLTGWQNIVELLTSEQTFYLTCS